MYKKIVAILFIAVLFIPALLGIAASVAGVPVDVELKGFSDNAERPGFSGEGFASNEYQTQFTAWFEETMPLRGVWTKAYASLRYYLFSLGNRIVGTNGDIFEEDYVNVEFGIGDQYDLSLEENQAKMDRFVDTLVSVQEKLQKHGKYLYIYIPANKADFHAENVSQKYHNMTGDSYVGPLDYFEEKLSETSIPYLICADMKEELEYPAFYTTGIHWSRTFEQKVSARIVSELSQITGKQYRPILLGDVKESTEPFRRDSDVYDLLNIWGKPGETYYEYEMSGEAASQYDSLRCLIYGDSFGQGLCMDYLACYPMEDVSYINRDNYVLDPNGAMTYLNHSWDFLDWEHYLSVSDVVVIEMLEHLIIDETLGFVDALNTVLDTYEGTGYPYAKCIDAAASEDWSYDSLKGVYHKEAGFVWATQHSVATICDPELSERGLELSFVVPQMLFADGGPVTATVRINGVELREVTYDQGWDGSLYFTPEELKPLETGDGLFSIEIDCSHFFIPQDLGIGDDTRELSIQIRYIGGTR